MKAPHSWGFLFYPFNVDMDYSKLIPLGKRLLTKIFEYLYTIDEY